MKIGVVGSINMDMVISADRIPKKGETLNGSKIEYFSGGKGANQAVAVSRLGGNVTMFGAVGNDDYGKKLLKSLNDDGVNTEFIKVIDDINSGLAIITVGENDNTIIVVAGANALVDKAYIDSIKDELLSCEMIIMQHEIPLQTNEYVVKLCKEKGIKTLLNPAPANEISQFVIENVDYITPNEHEAQLIFKDKVEENLEKYNEKLIITLGENGVMSSFKDGKIIKVPCRKSNVVDTTGAGDTFNGAFAYFKTSGHELEKALTCANIAAGLSTEKKGAQSGMPTISQVNNEIKI